MVTLPQKVLMPVLVTPPLPSFVLSLSFLLKPTYPVIPSLPVVLTAGSVVSTGTQSVSVSHKR